MGQGRQKLALVVGIVAVLGCIFEDSAAEPYPFSGYFRVTGGAVVPGGVSVGVSVTLFNRSGAEARGAAVLLEESRDSNRLIGTFGTVDIADRGSLQLTGEFVIPVEEYELWRKGRSPQLCMHFGDVPGTRVRRVELIPWPNN